MNFLSKFSLRTVLLLLVIPLILSALTLAIFGSFRANAQNQEISTTQLEDDYINDVNNRINKSISAPFISAATFG